jgi:hypothetical protein
MAVLRHPLPTALNREYGSRPRHHLFWPPIHDLPDLLMRLWCSTARWWYARILDVAGRVALVSGLILAAAFPPWRVTYTFATNNKEALYQCREYVGVGPIVGGKAAIHVRTFQPSGEFRLQSKAPWASFPNRIHCVSYTSKQIGISSGRWLIHFVVVLTGYGLLRRAHRRLLERQPSNLLGRAGGSR